MWTRPRRTKSDYLRKLSPGQRTLRFTSKCGTRWTAKCWRDEQCLGIPGEPDLTKEKPRRSGAKPLRAVTTYLFSSRVTRLRILEAGDVVLGHALGIRRALRLEA